MKQTHLAVRVAALDGKLRADVLLVPIRVVKGKAEAPVIQGLSTTLRKHLAELCNRYRGAKSSGSIDSQILPAGAVFSRIAIVSLGSVKPAKRSDVRDAAGQAMGWCAKHRGSKVVLAADALGTLAGADAVGTWVEGAILGSYQFVALRSKPPENGETKVSELVLATTPARRAKVGRLVSVARKISEAVNLTRTLGHEPPNIINPVTLAARVRSLARQFSLRCKVFDDRRLKAMKMEAMLAVGSGSASKPRLIILEHPGSRPKSRPCVLVGKAVTLDTGGYSIKPAASIPDMKYDKQGGMTVIGVLVAAARLKVRRRIVGIIGAAENMISGTAYRPGDIVRASNGTTIEVANTDAEGRLVLADCLHYAEKTYHPRVLIDLATLTGACEIALGHACAAVLGNNDELAQALITSGEATDERLWRLPLWPVYREQITGVDGDIKNVGGRPAGTITAAMFLKEFVRDKTPWAHLDIAGVADTSKALPTCPIGATGFGVRLLLDYLQGNHDPLGS